MRRSGGLVQLGDIVPDRESLVSISTEIGGGLLMTLKVEEVGGGLMNGEKLLGLSG